MANIVLKSVTGAISATGAYSALGPFGSFARGFVNKSIGSFGNSIDAKVFGYNDTYRNVTGRQLSNLAVQASTYGDPIPKLYGQMRMAGNIIWSRPIKETATTTTSTSVSGGGKGAGPSRTVTNNTTYSYSITLAIALCEGEIDEVIRVWADAKLIDPTRFSDNYTLYTGTETQLPDPTIESFEGIGNTPAYRGLCYVVIEDFPLADYGNRIPNFTFEVKRKVFGSGIPVEHKIKSMVMIPGSGEFVYDTVVQKKVVGQVVGGNLEETEIRTRINQTNYLDKANALVALDQMQKACPNVDYVAVVVTWFGDSLDAGTCIVRPGVEFKTGATTTPDVWSVAGINRASAYQITLIDNSPRYGGTPSDSSVVRYITELKNRGLKVMFYPMMFMDVSDKPWRGRMSGSAANVASFFTKTQGYNAFINHYANLVAGKVDAFVIGSELIGLTKVNDGSNNFPAVNALVNLAATVKSTLGAGVKITYAADWSEYHHTDGGWYNLDPLWASPNIDVVGIDAYFPLTNEPQQGITKQKIMDGWTSGEGYDFYYTDGERTTTAPLGAAYAWKNLDWWWKNTHYNPNGSATSWVPQSKKIWFTEFGFPSVDGCSNQPNVFYDPLSVESFFPRFSRGRVDFQAQRLALDATYDKWAGSNMLERLFLWTWDARPFPYYPDLLDVWADGHLWAPGHWVNGKLGASRLGAIVADLCMEAGLQSSQFDTSALTDLVIGYNVPEQMSVREAIQQLGRAYFFDAVERDGQLVFVKRGKATPIAIDGSNLHLKENEAPLRIERTPEMSLPAVVDVTYLSQNLTYQVNDQHARRRDGLSVEKATLNLPIVLSDSEAQAIAEATLYTSWLSRNTFQFELPIQFAWLDPTDRVQLNMNGTTHTMRIMQISVTKEGLLGVSAVSDDASSYDFYRAPAAGSGTTALQLSGASTIQMLDISPLPGDTESTALLRFAVRGQEAGWHGTVLYRSDDNGANYAPLASQEVAGVQGIATTVLPDGDVQRFDEKNSVTVLLYGTETLASITDIALLNGANAALLGNEVIQFRTATFLGNNQYNLSGLLRGRLGTDYATNSHSVSERFVLLDKRVGAVASSAALIGTSRLYKAVSIGETLAGADAFSFTYQANSLKPFSPVQVKATRDGSGNISLSWMRRARVHGEWQNLADVPLDETSEGYEVDIVNGSGNVVRTIKPLVTAAATYSAALQVTDFGAAQSSLRVRIYQLSAVVGRGFARDVII